MLVLDLRGLFYNDETMHCETKASDQKRPACRLAGLRRLFGRWIGIGCIWLVLFEVCAQVAVRMRPDWLLPDVSWSKAECYAGVPWADRYFREWWELDSRWEPYVYWRSRAFAGEFINISDEGIRRTWQPEGLAADAYRIVFFGGSTLWGLGVRDDYTIPSLVSQRLADEAARPVEVVNLGELGYVSTQSLVLLLREIQAGRIPDLVVFYDGVNDVFSAFQAGRAGIPQNEYRREKEFNLLRPDGGRTVYLSAVALFRVVQQSALVRLAGRWAGARKPRVPEVPVDPEQTGLLADSVHRVYQRNLEMVQALAARTGFEVLFYWQPSVFSKPERSPHEELEYQAFHPLAPLTLAVNRRLAACAVLQAASSFHDVSGLFESVPEGLFFDYCHLGEGGNALIAERLAGDILDLMKKGHRE